MNPPRRAGAYARTLSASRMPARSRFGSWEAEGTHRAFSSGGGVEERLRRPQRFLRVLVRHALDRLVVRQELSSDVLVANRRLLCLGSAEEEDDRLLDQPFLAIAEEVSHVVAERGLDLRVGDSGLLRQLARGRRQIVLIL